MPWLLFLLLFDFTPQSPEAWRYFVSQGRESITRVYTTTPDGLVCHQSSQAEVRNILESLAQTTRVHPARIAEEMTVYLWNDWTLLHVSDYDTREVLSNLGDRVRLEAFLEQVYKEHHVCLLGILKVLTQSYEGYYDLQGNDYLRLPTPTGERYVPLALEPKYFPGTGILEPLGLVYAVKLGDLLTVDWLREKAIVMIAETLQRRTETSRDPLKVRN
jgi:hypothetical protein